MSLSFTNRVEPEEPTHKLVTRDRQGIKDWDEAGRIPVENRAVARLLGYWSAVHVQIDDVRGLTRGQVRTDLPQPVSRPETVRYYFTGGF